MPTTTAPRTQLSDAEMALRLDATMLFLEELRRLPQFVDRAAGIEQLADAVMQARSNYEHGIIDREQDGSPWLEELGLIKPGPLTEYEPSIDPGYGREIVLLTEKLERLAGNVIGVTWNHEERCWEEDS